jgi:hypothetical protein
MSDVGLDIPWSGVDPAGRDEPAHLIRSLGPHFEVVEDRDHLAVHRVGAFQRSFAETIENIIEHIDQAGAVNLKCLIPLTIPVGAEHIKGLGGGTVRRLRAVDRAFQGLRRMILAG